MNRLNVKKDKIINLTDIGNNNPVRARRLPYGTRVVNNDPDITSYPMPGVGIVNPEQNKQTTNQQPKGLMRSASDPSNTDTNNNNAGFVFAISENHNKELHNEDPLPEDPEPHDLERLEALGATILKSETYFPQSRQTVTTRSMIPEERRAEQERQYYLDR